jgi:predicted DNA binding CopG/RHH family protein
LKAEKEKEMTIAKTKVTSDVWDERKLGADSAHVGVADESYEVALTESLEMQSISIRLPVELVKQYKLIAGFHGVGYQPLMRDILHRFVPGALKEILERQIKLEAQRPKREPLIPIPEEKKAA